jgi:hypothetical protein
MIKNIIEMEQENNYVIKVKLENILKQLATELRDMTNLGFVMDVDSDYIAYEKSNNDLSFEYYHKKTNLKITF